MKKKYTKPNLTIRVDITTQEVSDTFREALRTAELEYSDRTYEYYKIYLKHMFGDDIADRIDISAIMRKLIKNREVVEYHISSTDYSEEYFVRQLLTRNQYVSKSTNRPGVTVKLFHTYRERRDIMVKTYVYDGECPSLDDRMMACFKDEVLFQYYANNQTKLDFISPEIYSWGSIRKYQYSNDNYQYKCLFIIMEYIPGLTLAKATYTTDTMKTMYERVKQINHKMISVGIHHNDLHSRNVMVVEKSPLPEVIILDFGEASFGPRKPLFI
jgi:hypothetical protein